MADSSIGSGPRASTLRRRADGHQGRDPFEIRCIRTESPHGLSVLHRVFGLAPPPAGRANAKEVANLLANVRRGTVSTDLFFGAYQGGTLISACLVAESPGSTAMVFVWENRASRVGWQAAVATVRAAKARAWDRSIELLEALVAPGSEWQGHILASAGFRFLTRLRYLVLDLQRRARSSRAGIDVDWVSYSPGRERLFQEALKQTYVQTRDCPELTVLRSTADALAGHRATGLFDPALWWVAVRRGEPVGVILLNRIPAEPALELDYMGVSPAARGTGVADALLDRAWEDADRLGAKIVALAVDQRNTPARRLYARWGFVETGMRDAWIASSSGTRT